MNKSFIKLLTDFGPLLIFFIVYYKGGKNLQIAIPPLIVATIINSLFAIALLIGKLSFKKNLLQLFLSGSIQLQDIGWDKLMFRWASFFVFLAILNEFVWRTQTEEFWINFKVWGILPITLLFTIFQLPLIKRHKVDE